MKAPKAQVLKPDFMAERPKPNNGRNLTIAALTSLTQEEIAALDAATLARLHEEARAEAEALKRRTEALLLGIDLKYGARARDIRISQAKDTGIVRVLDGDAVIEQTVQRRVDWDQEQLAELAAKIRKSGDDPGVYMKVERKVSETAYKDWPEKVRAAFKPARTVKTGKPIYSIVIKDVG